MSEGLCVDIEHRQGAFALRARFAAPGGVTALFGRSGSGKTTLVNAIGGLVRPARGRIVAGGTVLLDTERGIRLPPHRRRIGYVFQEARLFPHLTVRQNLLFGRWFAPRREAGASLAAVVDLLGIGHLLARRPAGLSGGERQRVAIGRAILAKPRLLLMDEPLASLDGVRKEEILPFVERLRDETRLPIVYVSHAMAEVARLADTLVVLDGGRVAACGPASEVLTRLDLGIAGEAGAILEAVVASHDAAFGLTTLATPAGDIQVARLADPVGARRRIQIHPRDVTLSCDPPGRISALNVLAGTVAEIGAATGPAALVRVDCGGVPILAAITRRSVASLSLAPGVRVHLIVKSVALAGRDAAGTGA